jgi:hypothetical protein
MPIAKMASFRPNPNHRDGELSARDRYTTDSLSMISPLLSFFPSLLDHRTATPVTVPTIETKVGQRLATASERPALVAAPIASLCMFVPHRIAARAAATPEIVNAVVRRYDSIPFDIVARSLA